MISAIIPSYRNPQYLDLCLKSATEGKALPESEIIVVLDGYADESMAVVEKYTDVSMVPLSKNYGMQYALNMGVMNATNPYVFILNDDNVFPPHWDCRIAHPDNGNLKENQVVTINQVEPAYSIFNFLTNNLGRTAAEFDYDRWKSWEGTIAGNDYTPDGRLFPFIINKRWYMTVGGFDTFYQSPFWCDVDFWLKLELTRQLTFKRWHGCHLYHFGSIATKNRGDAESEVFKKSESFAAQQFLYKWGFIPNVVENARSRNNSKLPLTDDVKGISFSK